jgi:hypothetical protein
LLLIKVKISSKQTLSWKIKMVRFTKDSELSMLMNMRKNQLKVNSTRSLVFSLKETSSLSQHFQEVDTLTWSIIEIWSKRLEMEEELNCGISINNLWLSKLDWTTNLGTSRALERLMTCKSGVLTQDGSKCSNLRTPNSSVGITTRFLKLRTTRMKKAKQLES